MRRGHDHILGAVLEQRSGGLHNGAAGVDHVVYQHTRAAFHLTNQLVDLDLVGHRGVATLVDDRERCAHVVGPLVGQAHAAGIGRNDGQIVGSHTGTHVLREHGHGPQMVHGTVEEALNLRSVQVHRHDAVGTRSGEQVGHEASADGLAALVLLVLARVAVARHDHGDRFGGGALHGVHHDEVLHDGLVDGRRVGLQHEHVSAAHALTKAHIELTVGKGVSGGGQQLNAELLRDLLSQLRVGATAGNHQSTFARVGDNGAHGAPDYDAGSCDDDSG